MSRYTKIICTMGPASWDLKMLKKMSERGMNVARINCSHGTHEDYQDMIDLIRKNNATNGFDVKVLIDLAGYRIRVKKLKKKHVLNKDDIYYMSNDDNESDNNIPFDYEEPDFRSIKKNCDMFIDDGRLHLKIIGVQKESLKLKVVQGGVLKSRKGINIPTLKLRSNIMTEQDETDLNFALKNNVEFIAQSFVRNKKDIQRVVERVRPTHPECKIISKIESIEGVRNIKGIAEQSDGIMVARGDLGVTVPLHKIPMMQKYIIHHCNRVKKLSITATQMLDSMIDNGRPTRAEVSDVANAILDGSDYVMLSGETAVGKYPSRSILMMRNIVEYTEKYQDFRI